MECEVTATFVVVFVAKDNRQLRTRTREFGAFKEKTIAGKEAVFV
ncbi:hypothetical protein KL86PLE_90624 [uncultured Pleomorphomonas sp.]|uniref:Uncharacterized protein n=1 Tax=uncultured Pleomorphomonas sp. TaxID=442121 RepID=A0A212LQ93_9HYPH|nr:hypothetical protein KL86PLE_90624 [uncultured Pleomorphomonas sp.]